MQEEDKRRFLLEDTTTTMMSYTQAAESRIFRMALQGYVSGDSVRVIADLLRSAANLLEKRGPDLGPRD